MRRRKFLIGAGSFAAATAGAIGTGAVDSIRADRTYEIDVAGDADAYVGLKAGDSQFVSQSGGTLSLDFAKYTENGGEGVNVGTTAARPAFTLTNQGTKTIYAQIENPLSNPDVTTSASGKDASTANVSVPAGVDFQFLAVPKGSATSADNDIGYIGRGSPPSDGPDFASSTGQRTVRREPGSHRLVYVNDGLAGHVALDTGEAVDVIARVVATKTADPPVADFTVEAFTEQQYAQGSALGFTTTSSS